MVARISTGKSTYGALAYNERKVQQGEARDLGAINSMVDTSRQGLYEKNKLLQALASRNTRTTRNTYHIALSFAPGDRVSAEQLRTIAREYLEGIGFGGQPAFLYRHHDTANDHLHIVTTNIRVDGSRIADSFIGATKSQETRRAIEEKHGLVRAEEQQAERKGTRETKKQSLKQEARQTITGVLREFKPASLGELNALLREKELRLGGQTGLSEQGKAWQGYTVHRIDGRQGEDSSATVKASKVFPAGWSANLQQAFKDNEQGRGGALKRVRTVVSTAFSQEASRPEALRTRLDAAGVAVIEHRNAQGYLYGLHYVATKSGHVFKASEVGRAVTAAAWRERERTNGLAVELRKELDGVLKAYVSERTAQLGLRSAVVQQLHLRELQAYFEQRGYSLQVVTPYLTGWEQAEKRAYPRLLKQDQGRVTALQRGIEQLHLAPPAGRTRGGGQGDQPGGFPATGTTRTSYWGLPTGRGYRSRRRRRWGNLRKEWGHSRPRSASCWTTSAGRVG